MHNKSEELLSFFNQLNVCYVCCGRFSVDTNHGEVVDTLTDVKTPEPKKLKFDHCSLCLGLFDEKFLDKLAENVVQNTDINEFVDFEEFQCTISYPKIVLVREHTLKLLLKNRFQIDYFQNVYTSVSKMWRTHFVERLTSVLNRAHRECYDNSNSNNCVSIDCTVSYDDDNKLLQPLEQLDPDYYGKRKIQRRKFKDTLFSKKSIMALLERVDENAFLDHIQYPANSTSTSELRIESILIRRNPLYLGGRYLKYSRDLPQSPWTNTYSKTYDSSIEELILGPLAKCVRSNKSLMVFSASGREDIDVRCLGNGRPFVVEVRNPKLVNLSETQMTEFQGAINSSTKLIEVLNLQVISSNELKNLKDGEEDKSKTYIAYCISERALDSLEDLNNLIGPDKSFIEIQQKTPIRVLHRRTLATRSKNIYEINAQFCDGYSDRFLMKISTQAGTYIKEFVHSDFGRTHPSVTSILGCNVSIAALDVVSINFDWLLDKSKINN